MQCYGSWRDPEETATVGMFPVTGHLQYSPVIVGITITATIERTSRFVYVTCELLYEYWHRC